MPIRALSKPFTFLPSRVRWGASSLLAAGFLLGATPTPAHDIPVSVTAFVYVKAEGQRLRVLVRAPLESMRDVSFPTRGPGYLDIAAADSLVRDAAQVWIASYLDLYEEGRLLQGRITRVHLALPSDRSFDSFESAAAGIAGPPLPRSTEIPWRQVLLDVELEYPVQSAESHFSVHPALAHLGLTTRTVLRFLPYEGTERALQYTGDPGLVQLDPRWHQAAGQFVQLGFTHILDGIDHLLFVLCLVIPVRRWRPLVAIVTAFTVAHSITLVASAAGWAPSALWFPPLIETLIALSIVYMAIENLLGARLDRRWMLAFGFGLVHGFGFSFALRESMQFAGSHLLTSLLSFNFGVELGQIFVIALALPVLALVYRRAAAERPVVIVLSALVGHAAWHWMVERWAVLRGFQFAWPVLDLAFAASAMRGLMLLLIAVGGLWALHGIASRLTAPAEERERA